MADAVSLTRRELDIMSVLWRRGKATVAAYPTPATGGRIVDESHAPSHWTLADRAGNCVCICAWPDSAPTDR